MPTRHTMPALATRTLQVDNCEIHLSETGDGFPVLMLHGGGPGASGVSNYSRNIAALAERFRVIIPDMPGYGRSAKRVNRKDPFGGLARYMLGLLDALDIQTAHVIGNSLGGAVALRMALDAPARAALDPILEAEGVLEPLLRQSGLDAGYEQGKAAPFGKSLPVFEEIRN